MKDFSPVLRQCQLFDGIEMEDLQGIIFPKESMKYI